MKAIIAKASIQDGKEKEFEQVALELAANVNADEPGCRLYVLGRSDAGEYYFLEIYEDETAMQAHRDAPHLAEAGPKFMGVMAGRPEITVLDVIDG